VTISLAGQLSRYVMLRRLLPDLVISPRLFDRSLVRSLGGLSGWYSLRAVSGAVFAAIDVIIVGVVVGVVAAGIYAVGQRLAMLVANTLRPGVDVLFPHAAHAVGGGNRSELRATVATGSRIAVGIAFPVCLVTAVLARPAIRAWVGPGFDHAAIVVVLLGASTAVTAVTLVGATVILGSGDPKVPTIVTALAAATRVALGVALGRVYGIAGVALAALISAVIFNGMVMLVIVCRRFGMRPGAALLGVLRAHLPAIVCAGLVGAYLAVGPVGHFVDVHRRIPGIAVVVAGGLAMLVTYFSVFAFTGLARDERRSLFARVQRLHAGAPGELS
jgi:O-antigen/teichoic acid export membrane protein